MIAVGHILYVVETNHNSILRIDPESGEITRIRDFSVQDPAPISMVHKGEYFYLGSFDGLVQKFRKRVSLGSPKGASGGCARWGWR